MCLLKQEYPGCEVYGQTATNNHHEELSKIGVNPSLKWTKDSHKFPYVIFCAPPYQSSDYLGDLRLAILSLKWVLLFMFTSCCFLLNLCGGLSTNQAGCIMLEW